MDERPDPRDLELLELQPGAGMGELRRAYQLALATWEEGSLATYGLVEPAERDAILARLTAAYERLASCLHAHTPATPPPRAASLGDRELPGPPSGEKGIGQVSDRGAGEIDPGSFLRSTRLAGSMGLDAVARETRIRQTILEALEKGRTDLLPASVYIRGFVIAYAEAVGIKDPERLARRYLEWLEGRRT